MDLAVVLDAFSRRIVGWNLRNTLHANFLVDVLHMAARHRRASDVILHPDHGSQYRAVAFGQRCKLLGVRRLMGSRGDACDNAMAESFFATLPGECLATRPCATRTKARLAIFRYFKGWYAPHRHHSAPGQRPPLTFEQAYAVHSLIA